MNKTELLQIFSIFTREDWQQMETMKNTAFQPTQEDINLQIQEQQTILQNKINETKEYLSNYGIEFNGTETDFKQLFTQYLWGDGISLTEEEKENGTTRNFKFSEGFGTDEQILNYIEQYSQEYGTVNLFCDFILDNEKAK